MPSSVAIDAGWWMRVVKTNVTRTAPGGQAQPAFCGFCQHRRVGRDQRQRRVRRRGTQEVRHDPILQERQHPASLLRRQIVAGRAPCVPGSLGPLGRPQLERLFAGLVPGQPQPVLPQREAIIEHRSRDERRGQCGRPELRQGEPRTPRGSVSCCGTICHRYAVFRSRPPWLCPLFLVALRSPWPSSVRVCLTIVTRELIAAPRRNGHIIRHGRYG
jgi:hypothetical protein